MTKKEFFKGYEHSWNHSDLQWARVVCWELYNLELLSERYNNIMSSERELERYLFQLDSTATGFENFLEEDT